MSKLLWYIMLFSNKQHFFCFRASSMECLCNLAAISCTVLCNTVSKGAQALTSTAACSPFGTASIITIVVLSCLVIISSGGFWRGGMHQGKKKQRMEMIQYMYNHQGRQMLDQQQQLLLYLQAGRQPEAINIV